MNAETGRQTVARCAMGDKRIVADDEWLLPHVELDANEARITPAMFRAGVAALANWDYDKEGSEARVAAI